MTNTVRWVTDYLMLPTGTTLFEGREEGERKKKKKGYFFVKTHSNGRGRRRRKQERGGVAFYVGQRVQSLSCKRESNASGGEIGTVKYVGRIDGYEGIWVGVDWDSGEGRHDGTVNGNRYFETHSEKSGSCVRPQALSPGITLLQAIASRYIAASVNPDIDDMYLLSARQNRVAVKLVGREKIEEKQKHLEELVTAALVYAGVSSAGPPGELHKALPKLEELDLTGSLIPSWNVVCQICEEFPSLRILDLSNNRIQFGLEPISIIHCLKVLVLNHTGTTWKQVESLKSCFPFLEELHLCKNGIAVLEIENSASFCEGFKYLRLLNLDDNMIENWEEIVKLSLLNSLEQLQVGGNRLKSIFYPKLEANKRAEDSEEPSKPFLHLHSLLVGGNQLSDWESLDALNSFPNLTEVRLSDNPITDLNAGGASRFMLIARLAKATMVNGSEVKQKERRDAEIRYVHFVMNALPRCSTEERTLKFPRFSELKNLHDVPDDSVNTKVVISGQHMGASLLSITLVCVAPSIGEISPLTRKLPPSTTIGKLKTICQMLFKLKSSNQRLFLREEDGPVPIPLTEDMETLGSLVGIGREATILVDEALA